MLLLALAALAAGTSIARADPCAGLDGYAYHHCSTAAQADMMARDYWARLTPRERQLTRLANAAVDQFRAEHGRLPNDRDRRWGRAVAAAAGLRSEAEGEFLVDAMNSRIHATRELERIEADICGAARMYGDMGFGHIYRGMMPECF
jgi:hypothetical protein